MKVEFHVVGSESDVDNLGVKDEYIHFCFRPSEKDIFKLIRKSPNLKMIQLPDSYYKTLSSTTKTLLTMNNIKVKVGNVWGHRTDIDTYTTVEI